jgi:8-oxo-dGTP pyrophosphatase MutT (NUDIX family)
LLREGGGAWLQHRDNKPELNYPNMWGFPGGQCNAGEDFAVCARREFCEETEYDCRSLQWLTTMPLTVQATGIPYDMAIFWEIFDGVQKLGCHEGQEMKFIERQDAPKYVIPDHLLPLWDLALERLKAQSNGGQKG